MIKFNINDHVYVRVLPPGEKLWRKFHDDLRLDPAKYPLPTPNADGLTRFQLWDAMHIFGAGMYNGGNIPIATEIYLDLPEPQSSLDTSRESFGHKDDHP